MCFEFSDSYIIGGLFIRALHASYMNKQTDIWISISAVLNGTCTAEEKQLVDEWTAGNEKNKRFLHRLQTTSFSLELEQEAHASKEGIYLLVQEKIKRVRLTKRLRWWQGIAAAAVFFLLTVNTLNFIQDRSVPVFYMESKSPVGSTSRLTLSDGTIVELNAGSTITYPQVFEGNDRTVSLVGEAFFDVSDDADRPFVVHTEKMDVKVLGTSFDVKAYADDDKTIVTLLEGEVRVHLKQGGAPEPVRLKPNQQIIFNKATDEFKTTSVNAEYYAAWRNGICFFENEKMRDIAKMLSRQYGVKISILSEKIENQVYSGFFSKQEGLYHILNSFKRNRYFDYKQTEHEIELYETKADF